MAVRIEHPGMQTTVQDLGRFGHANMGVPRSGAADTLSLLIANRLLGNPEHLPGLECTLIGPTLRFDHGCSVCLVGADTPDASILRSPGAKPDCFTQCVPVLAEAGAVLTIGPLHRSARAVVCFGGGVAVPPVLGSRSTLLTASLGGIQGRALRMGDVLELGTRPTLPPTPSDRHTISQWLRDRVGRRTLRITPGLHAGLLMESARSALTTQVYQVSDRSNRVGLRLQGLALSLSTPSASLDSEGTIEGAIQIPPDGQPMILGPDRPTTGGYAMPATVIAADLPVVGALRPRDRIRFEWIDPERARKLAREQRAELDALLPARIGSGCAEPGIEE